MTEGTQGETPSPYFSSLARWVITHSKTTIMIILGITVWAMWTAATQIKVDNSLEMFAPRDAQVVKSRDRYRSLFGRDDLFLISVRGDVFTEDFLQRLGDLEKELKTVNPKGITLYSSLEEEASSQAVKGTYHQELDDFDDEDEEDDEDWSEDEEGTVIEETTSLVSVRRTAQVNGGLLVKPWFEPVPPQEEIDRLRPLVLKDPLIAKRLIDEDGELTVLMVKVALMSDDDLFKVFLDLREITERFQNENFILKVTGPPAVNSALNEIVVGDLSKLLLISGFAMFIALIYLFRSWTMVIGPIVVVGISVIWTMGLMGITGMTLNLLSSILPAFLLCVGLGDSIHLQSIFNTRRIEGDSVHEAIINACGLTGPPVLFTSLSTMIGLLSFQFASVTAIKEMGVAGGVGVMFALINSLVTLPLFLKHCKRAPEQRPEQADGEPKDRIDRALYALVMASRHKIGRAVVLVGTVALAALSILGVLRLEVWHDDLESLPDNHPIKSAVLEVDRELGGVANAQLLISTDGGQHTLRELDILRRIDQLSQHILAYRSPKNEAISGHAMSLVDVVKETHRALLGGDEHYRLPSLQDQDAQLRTSQLLGLFELQSPDQLRTLTTIDLNNAHLTLQIKWQEATSYEHLIKHIQSGIDQHFEPLREEGVAVEQTGGVYLAYTIVTSLLDDLTKSFGAAFLVITFLMVLMLRGLKLGLLAMIPNLFPILLMLGALGLLGIPLDLNNLLIASIALGIAVDDTIHLLHHFQASYLVHGDRELALQDALTHAGRAMLSTSILLSVGFIVYLFASIEAVQRFGVIISLTVITALLVDLIVCPAILRLAYPSAPQSQA